MMAPRGRSRSAFMVAGFLAGIAVLPGSATAADSVLRKLRKGDAVEAKGVWDASQGVFQVLEIEKLPKPHRPSVRGAIEFVDSDAAKFLILGRDVRVIRDTAFTSVSGESGGSLSDLQPGARVEVTAKVDETGAWKATKVVW